MAEQKNLELAKATYDTLCKTLENNDWHYDKDDEKLCVKCGARGEDLPIDISINVDAERMLVVLLSHMPYTIQEDKLIDTAVAVSVVNNVLVDGCFDYDVTTGHIFFRMTNSFYDSKISEEVFAYLLFCSCQTIDEYNDKFFMLSKGMISIEDFMSEGTN